LPAVVNLITEVDYRNRTFDRELVMNVRAIRSAACCAAATAVLLIYAAGASAAGITFTVTGFSDGSGSCTRAVCTTLRAAVASADANPGSTIALGAGTYTLSSGELDIDSTSTQTSGYALSITGAGENQTVIQQTDGHDRVISIPVGGPYLLKDLEVTGGHLVGADGSGTSDGAGVDGGGIAAAGTETDLDGVLITGNTVTGGNGASATGSTDATYAGFADGGGFYDDAVTSTITDSTITDNSAIGGDGGSAVDGTAGSGGDAYGGGLNIYAGTVSDSTITDNSAIAGNAGDSAVNPAFQGGNAYGGGVGSGALVDAELINTTVSGNSAIGGAAGTGTGTGTGTGYPGYGFGGGVGGWIYTGLSLFNDTLTDNSATGHRGAPDGYGGNLADTSNGDGEKVEISDTVLSGGTASNDADCSLPASGSNWHYDDLGHNLEDDQPSVGNPPQCEPDGAASTDLIGIAPKLGPLAANGGLTETELPQAGSPLIRAGGACLYENTSDSLAAFTTDQRGEPRGSVCDIGAVQIQAPAATGLPQITGIPTVGDTLTCSPPTGIFSGDELTYTYAWLRGTSVIPGANSSTYELVAADVGQQISCSVAATGVTGAAVTATSAASLIPGPGTIGLAKTRLTYKRGRVAIELRCTVGQTGCAGTYKLYIVERHGKKTTDVTLAKGSYTLASGKTKTSDLKLKLSKAQIKAIQKRGGKLATVMLLSTSSGAVTKTKTAIRKS
jgi:hypothetical protein